MTCRRRAGNSCKAHGSDFESTRSKEVALFSKILLFTLLVLLVSKFGLFTRLRRLKPRLDRAVNLTIIGLGLIYVGHLLWWLAQASAQH